MSIESIQIEYFSCLLLSSSVLNISIKQCAYSIEIFQTSFKCINALSLSDWLYWKTLKSEQNRIDSSRQIDISSIEFSNFQIVTLCYDLERNKNAFRQLVSVSSSFSRMNQLARLRPDKFDDKIVNEQISLVKTKTKISYQQHFVLVSLDSTIVWREY